MNVYAMYGVGGLLSISLLFFGMYSMSNVVGKVTYEKPESQTASVVVTNVPTLDEEIETSDVIEEEETKEVEPEREVELVPAVEEAPIPEPEPAPEEDVSTETETIAALQDQVNSLLEQVSEATESTVKQDSYFVTPSGLKIDANGNIVNDDGATETQATESVSEPEPVQNGLPSGYYRLPSGVIIGPGGVVVDEEDIVLANVQEEQANVTSLDYFITPSGQKIDRYGNIVE